MTTVVYTRHGPTQYFGTVVDKNGQETIVVILNDDMGFEEEFA
tara:strand:+ start:818 stop:946 length:129 start_codon:yes stop_codon:yes gene_type:complete